MNDTAGEVETAFHTAAELLDRLFGAVQQSRQVENFLDPTPQLSSTQALCAAPVGQILTRRQVFVQGYLLRNHPHTSPGSDPLPNDVVTHDANVPGGRREEA